MYDSFKVIMEANSYHLVCFPSIFIQIPNIGNDRPTLRQLTDVIEECSTRWHDLGVQLLEEHTGSRILNEIENDCPSSVVKCCRKMFDRWLEQQPNASWDQLLTALNRIGMNSAAEHIRGKFNRYTVAIH